MQAVRVHGRQGVYARDKNTSARLCAKNSGVSLYTRGEGRICGTLRYIGCIHIDFTDSQAHLGMFAHAQAVFGKKDS